MTLGTIHCIIIKHVFSDEVRCGYKCIVIYVWRELLWSMLWLRPGGKLRTNKHLSQDFIMQTWVFICLIKETLGCVITSDQKRTRKVLKI